MKIAIATLSNFHAKPFGPELQVKQMFYGRDGPSRIYARAILGAELIMKEIEYKIEL